MRGSFNLYLLPFAACFRGLGDARIEQCAHALEEFQPGGLEMVARVVAWSESAQPLTKERSGTLAETRTTLGFLIFRRLFVHIASWSSTTNRPPSSRARTGESPVIDWGRPTWRRTVPTSITSSSPFLKSPTSPLAANGAWRRTSYRPSRLPKE